MKKKTLIIIAVTGVLAAAAAVSVFWFGKEKRDREAEAASLEALFLRDGTGETVGNYLFVDTRNGTPFTGPLPEGAVLDERGDELESWELENGDVVKIYGNGAMTMSYPGQYPGITKIVRMEKENRELLEQMPCIRFLDLAVIFYCLIAVGEEGTASVAVKSEYRKVWDITLPQIYEQAKINTPKLLPYVLQTMLEVLGELCDGMDTSGAVPMYVLTNQLRMNGAACILYPDVLRECSRKIGGDLLILPSSIHEVILMPDHGNGNRAELREMVEEINQTQLEAEEVLSGQVYRYERNTNKIIL